MPNLSWNEVRDRAISFSRRWVNEASEAAGKQTFWNEFFSVFGRDRRTVAAFEVAVRNLRGDYKFIDLLWRGMLLVEHKSTGKNLVAAESQAFAYIADLAHESRFDEIPRYIIISDFARFALYDLEPDENQDLPHFAGKPYSVTNFPLSDLHRYVRHFAFLKGERTMRLDPEDPANEKAYSRMCQLHDELTAIGFVGSDLERLLVRILFCVFADDTGVFEPATFENFIRHQTREDGSDLGARLNELFEILDTPEDAWPRTSSDTFSGFRYINGELFSGHLRCPPFTRSSRDALLSACEFQWARVSPAVFGSLFQGIMDGKTRRQQGAHYTSERDIMKLIRSLFLDDFAKELETVRADRSTRRKTRLEEYHQKLRSLRFLDPACGCGNFLVLSYRELRQLELEVLRDRHADDIQRVLNVRDLIRVDVDQFSGIEYSEWPRRIAEVAMWLMDHQMNQRVSEAFGQSFERLPLRTSPHIVQGNALLLDWTTILAPTNEVLIMGNPPFVGAKFQSADQRSDMASVAGDIENYGLLDYVSGWYFKAADYIRGTRISAAFVSTNSITQGEQVAPLWRPLIDRFGVQIHFAHRTFAWLSESRGKAHVHVVIIGFGCSDGGSKLIYDYDADADHPVISRAKNISPYLTDGPNVTVANRGTPICDVPALAIGNKPIDNGNYLFTPPQKLEFIAKEPGALKWFRRWYGSEEYINNIERWCLWLGDCPPEELQELPECLKRVEAVRTFRLSSKSPPTQRLASTPRRFHVENFPARAYLVIPEVSSERRPFIPIGFLDPSVLASNKLRILRDATLWHFGVLSSSMHMAWVRQVTGRLKSDFQYSVKLVYNNFPWPSDSDKKRFSAVESAAQNVLSIRESYLAPKGNGSLADLYDPLTMPESLVKAHGELDRAVERSYRSEPFRSDRERVEFIFILYQNLVSPLLPDTDFPRRQKRKKSSERPDNSQVDESKEPEDGLLEVAESSELPEWYTSAFIPQNTDEKRGEVFNDSLDLIYDRIDDMLTEHRLAECDTFLDALARDPGNSPLSALVGVLTITLPAASHLPHRNDLRQLIDKRLRASGQNADSALKGL